MSEEKKNDNSSNVHSRTMFGVIGQFLAVILSWSLNKSFLWAFFHCLLGWWYVIYYYFEYGNLNTISDFIHAMYK